MQHCKHRWRIDEVDGHPMVGGTCQECGERRDRYWPASDPNDYSYDPLTVMKLGLTTMDVLTQYGARQ